VCQSLVFNVSARAMPRRLTGVSSRNTSRDLRRTHHIHKIFHFSGEPETNSVNSSRHSLCRPLHKRDSEVLVPRPITFLQTFVTLLRRGMLSYPGLVHDVINTAYVYIYKSGGNACQVCFAVEIHHLCTQFMQFNLCNDENNDISALLCNNIVTTF
jgi:hypothetical protein